MKNINGVQTLSKAAQKNISGGNVAARACPPVCIRLYIVDADNNVCLGGNGLVGVVCGGKCCL